MGAAGKSTAIEAADVTLMDDDQRKLPRFVRLPRKTHAFWRVGGTMWMAVFADVGASLLVVANGLRLVRFRR